jgi:hypothetical protein
MTDAEMMEQAFKSCSPEPKLTSPTSRKRKKGKKGKAPSQPSQPPQPDEAAFKAGVRADRWAALKGVK